MTPQGFAAIAILLLVCIALIGGQDAEEQDRIHAEYCENVKTGAWGDYKQIYSKECEQ